MLTCGSCAFKAPDSEHCRIFKIPINQDKDHCPLHQVTANECASCHVLIPRGGYVITLNEEPALVCPTCLARMPQESYTDYKEVDE